jgi:predicted restriction endonuclease
MLEETWVVSERFATRRGWVEIPESRPPWRSLGTPHNGPDILENLLCLCPNDHVLFDPGAIYIEDALEVRESGSDTSLGALRLRRGHTLNRNYLAYHREHYAEQVGVSR